MEAYAGYYQVKYNLSDAEFATFVEQRCNEQRLYAEKHRRFTVDACHSRAIPLASHDDATAEHVIEAEREGLVIAEFPTTLAAAEASGAAGMGVMMGAPNLIRGGSHSGNVSARDLAALGLVDILSSDYVPASLLPAAFLMAEVVDGVDLPRAIRTVATDPASRVGLDDRGEIAIGKRADLVRVRNLPVGPVVRTVWREGDRVI
jgi:alpha-D-ribose 1-methylphosphonate 5-triphosphate diphosphatase